MACQDDVNQVLLLVLGTSDEAEAGDTTAAEVEADDAAAVADLHVEE